VLRVTPPHICTCHDRAHGDTRKQGFESGHLSPPGPPTLIATGASPQRTSSESDDTTVMSRVQPAHRRLRVANDIDQRTREMAHQRSVFAEAMARLAGFTHAPLPLGCSVHRNRAFSWSVF
jgi:hypothetical protein